MSDISKHTAMILGTLLIATGIAGALGGGYIVLSDDSTTDTDESPEVDENITENATEEDESMESDQESKPEDTTADGGTQTDESQSDEEPVDDTETTEDEPVQDDTQETTEPDQEPADEPAEDTDAETATTDLGEPTDDSGDNTTETTMNNTTDNTTENTSETEYENIINASDEVTNHLDNIRYVDGAPVSPEQDHFKRMRVLVDNPNDYSLEGEYVMTSYNGSEVLDTSSKPYYVGANSTDWGFGDRVDNGSEVTHYGVDLTLTSTSE